MKPDSRRLFLIVPALLFNFVAIQTACPETGLRAPDEETRQAGESSAVGANIDGVLATLASVAIKENISRFAGDGATARKLDSFETEVSITGGVEQYADVKGNHRTYHHVSEIRGLWSFGEVVTMLRTTRDIIDSSALNGISPTGDTPGGGEASDDTVIEFQSPAADHRWFVTVRGRIQWLEFQGTIRISRKTGEIERLTWTSGYGPVGTNVASILWDVNFSAVTIAGNTLTMPSNSIFRVVRKGLDRAVEWNLTRYAALGRYGSTESVRYER
jgi:hypothetical protein